jgi:[protein-PII] uridylyltransferase
MTLVTTQRDELIADWTIGGPELYSALASVTDDLLSALFAEAEATAPARRKGAVALVAVGGYGRNELAPYSDIDVVLVHDGRPSGIDELAAALWYPLWDAGLQLGHAVRSLDDQLRRADEDLDAATALLGARPVAGDEELGRRVVVEGRKRWARNGRRWLDALRSRVIERREQAGDVAFLLEPDLKYGHGGLRDVQTLRWAADGGPGDPARLVVPDDDAALLDQCYDTLVTARVALHRVQGRSGDVLHLEDQDAVAAALGLASADELMAGIAASARTVVWIADGAWRRASRQPGGGEEAAGDGLVVVDRQVELTREADPRRDPTVILRAARVAAQRGVPIGRSSLDRLAVEVDPAAWRDHWPDGAVGELVQLLRQGHRAIDVLEALDQRGLLVRLLPEWAPVRSRPQRNAYHRFTVDRHLWEAAANAAALADRVARPDLLVLGALFHDLGKGSAGDHIVAGMDLVQAIGPRLGLDDHDVATLVRLVQHHLLLPDVAVRRDLADPATIRHVADAVGDVQTLALLHALTEADSLATGPSAWGSWKEQLVAELVARTRHVLDGGDVTPRTWRRFPDDGTMATMAAGKLDVRIEDDEAGAGGGTQRITVVCDDRPGAFAHIAGVLSLRGLDVLTAWAYSGELGGPAMAASQYRVVPPPAGVAWGPLVEDLRRALGGELAIEARLAERARTYRRRKPTQARPPGPTTVTFHDDASSDATVIEVRAADRIGVLHRIANALAQLGLDIRHATVQTLGDEVVDTFYVRTLAGRLVTDEFHRGEIQRAVVHAVG